MAFDLLRIPRIRAGVFLNIALFLPVGFYDATLDRFLTDLGASNKLISLAFLAYGIPFALLATTGGRLADRRGPLRVGLIAAGGVGVVTMLYGTIHLPELFVLTGIIEGSIQAVGVPAGSAVIARGAPVGRAAAAQGLSGAGNLLTGAVTAYFAGAIYSGLGPRWMFLIAGLGVLLFGVLAATQRERPVAAIS
jgi:MFS family permease